eukprot:403331903
MELRAFYQKTNFQPSATASAYLEVVSPPIVENPDQQLRGNISTKLSCVINGPMQKSNDFTQSNSGGQDACTIKVNIQFADSLQSDSLLLEQHPDIEEQLHLQMSQMPSRGAAESVKERRMKFITGALQFEMQKVLQSCILIEKYPATSLVFQFDIVELDGDLIQNMINCAAIALSQSPIECRCIPVAISLLVNGDRSSQKKNSNDNVGKWLQVDPNVSQLRNQSQYSHKATFVVNVNTEEIISSSIKPLGKSQPLDLIELETLNVSHRLKKEQIDQKSLADLILSEIKRPQEKFEDDVLANRDLFVMRKDLKRKVQRFFNDNDKNKQQSSANKSPGQIQSKKPPSRKQKLSPQQNQQFQSISNMGIPISSSSIIQYSNISSAQKSPNLSIKQQQFNFQHGNSKDQGYNNTISSSNQPSKTISFQIHNEKLKHQLQHNQNLNNQSEQLHVKFQSKTFTQDSTQSQDQEDEIVVNPNKMLDNQNQRFFMTFNDKNKRRSMEFVWNRLSGIICNKRPKEYTKFMKKVEVMQNAMKPAQTASKLLSPQKRQGFNNRSLQNYKRANFAQINENKQDSQSLLALTRYQSVNASIQKSSNQLISHLQISHQPTEQASRKFSMNDSSQCHQSNHIQQNTFDQNQMMLQLNLFTQKHPGERDQRQRDEDILDQMLDLQNSKKGISKSSKVNGDLPLRQSIKRQERINKKIIFNQSRTHKYQIHQQQLIHKSFDAQYAEKCVLNNTQRFGIHSLNLQERNGSTLDHERQLKNNSNARKDLLPYFSLAIQSEENMNNPFQQQNEKIMFLTPPKHAQTTRMQTSKAKRHQSNFSFNNSKTQVMNQDLQMLSTGFEGNSESKEENIEEFESTKNLNEQKQFNTVIGEWDSVKGNNISGSHIPNLQNQDLYKPNNLLTNGFSKNHLRPKTARVTHETPSKNYYTKQENLYGVQTITNPTRKSLKQRALQEFLRMEQEKNQEFILNQQKRRCTFK